MTREQDERLTKLRESGIEIYSISRLGTINNCLAEAYKTYVLGERGKSNIYAILGSKTHDILEGIVNNKNTEEDLLPAVQSELDDMDALGINFPKDFKGGDSIREGWIADMEHFCKNYKSPRGNNLHTEELFIYKTPKGRYLQGFIDLYKENKDGSISIFDYKTSSMYSGEAIREHGYQLITYALGKMQEGYTVKSVAWIMLKYVDVEFMGYKTARAKEKTLITKQVERRKIAAEMAKFVENDLAQLGYDDVDSDIILTEFKQTNSFDCLPEEIRNNYKIKPCVFEYELTDERIQDCIDYIDTTIDKWEALDKTDESIFVPKEFKKVNKLGKEVSDTFYCCSLCGHFDTCSYIRDYLDTLQSSESSDDDLF